MNPAKTRPYLFVLASHNDIDHQVPVIWKMLSSGLPVRVLFADRNSNVDIRRDYRLEFLKRQMNCEVTYYYAVDGVRPRLANRPLAFSPNPVLMKLRRFVAAFMRRRVWNGSWAERVLKQIDPVLCIGDMNSVEPETIEGRLFFAAKRLGIPLIGLSHGPDVYVSFDWTDKRIARPMRLENFFDDPRHNVYDRFAVPTPHEKKLWQAKDPQGLKRIDVMGSPRYCPEWLAINDRLHPAFVPRKPPEGKLKVVFFMPHWRPHVKREETIRGIEAIAALDFVHLVVKEHTREGAGDLPDDVRERFRRLPHVEVIRSVNAVSFAQWLRSGLRMPVEEIVDSAALVKWADAVVCFASSVGIEAVCRNKFLINPVYMYTYASIYDVLGAGVEARDAAGLTAALAAQRGGSRQIPYNCEAFRRTVIYADKDRHDVLKSYVDLFVSAAGGRVKAETLCYNSTEKEER